MIISNKNFLILKNKFCIINSGFANLYSIKNAFVNLGIDAEIINSVQDLKKYSIAILPGVGSFKQVKDNLDKNDFSSGIKDFIAEGKPFLGICLGMQLLFSKGFEGIEPSEGLGIFEGEVVLLPKEKISRIPHMGWNLLKFTDNSSNIFNNFKNNNSFVYFVHSYYCKAEQNSDLIAEVFIEKDFCVPAIVKKNNVFGMQFHPERSGDLGLNILKAFAQESCKICT